MKQCFLKKTDKKSLDLVFLGYGQDEKPFQYLQDITQNSVALVYDYTDRDFDPSLYYEFENINLITWSMGVMAAPKVLNKYDIDIYHIDNSKLSSSEYAEFRKYINISGTPTVCFITNGEEETTLNRISGEVSLETTIERFKSNGYIK